MKNLRKDYGELIRSEIAKLNDKDENWKWSVHSISKDSVSIRWGYLDYCNSDSKEYFYIKLLSPLEDDEDEFISVRTPDDVMIDGEIVCENPTKFWQTSYDKAIVKLIRSLSSYAWNRY